MSDLDTLDERLRAVERTLADGDAEPRTPKQTTGDCTARVDELEARLAELDAAVQALRGYVGNVRAVNADVERRADAALATAEICQSESSAHPHREPNELQTETELQTERPGTTEPEKSNESNDGVFVRLRELL